MYFRPKVDYTGKLMCGCVQALGSLYFVHHSVAAVEMFNFHCEFSVDVLNEFMRDSNNNNR